MIRLLALFVLINSSKSFAQEDCNHHPLPVIDQAKSLLATANEVPGACADKDKLRGICGDILQKTNTRKGSPYMYEYERKIHEAACADLSKESEETANAKIRYMWSRLEDELTCDSMAFSVPRANILKYAVGMKSWYLVTSAAEAWQVNLNRVDQSDNATVLDYIKQQMDINKGRPLERELKSYYDLLRNHGAKHRTEL
jgi:hypothetical protein